jgi:amino acid transporter
MTNLNGWHLAILVSAIVPFALWIIALVQIAVSKAAASALVVWAIIVTLVPLIGPIVWFAIGKRTVTHPPAPPSPPRPPA